MISKARCALGVLAIGAAVGLPVSGKNADTAQPLSMVVEQRLAEARAADKADDNATALRLWPSLAFTGVAEAQYQVGMRLEDGRGFCRDDAKAADWLLKAGNQDYTDAERELGKLFYTSEAFRNTPDHEGSAAAWLELAAQKGDADAQFWLGRINSRIGMTLGQYRTAAEWYQKAADQGRSDAVAELGRLYDGGLGVAKSPTKAAFFYRKAAKADEADAQLELGRLYETGSTVPKDYVEAYKWYLLSATNNHMVKSASFSAGEAIVAKMTSAQIVRGKALARSFREVHPGQEWATSEGAAFPIMPFPISPVLEKCQPFADD